MKQLILDVRPDFVPTLDNFVAGDNAALVAALREQVQRHDGSVLYLWGPAGSGRSHLLAAAAGLADRPVYRDAVARGPAALHCLDDVEALPEAALADLFRLLIGAREGQRSLIVAGGTPPSALSFRDDVASRLAQGLVFEIRPLSDAQKKTALLQHAHARGLQFGEDIVDYLLRHGRRDLPWLMAVLDALDEASLSLGRPVTLPLLRELLAG
ncbi:DnaA regulatory inactivator Hda [Viridibacterium curvum]|uniref:DnaA regulatory inactivator Hda n=1 Tax=Viridibacterium curvum TaxID=1101404 RepID=A0ABP9R1V3_9RHOO